MRLADPSRIVRERSESHRWFVSSAQTYPTCRRFMITLRKANERGTTNIDWLDSRHSFSFGDYYDPANMGFGPLRVINEDFVAPGMGFGMHPHRDMEIITYIVQG